MTTEARFDRQLPAILEELYLGSTPDYRDEVLAVATDRRQRPAWAIPGRWIPMADIANRPAFAPRVPWRTLGVALLIVALAVAAIAIYVGSHQTKLPDPFGIARNGLVTYAAKGDIFVAEPNSGKVTAIVTDSPLEAEPVFSHDGTRIAFRRPVDGSVPLAEDIVAVRPDGSDPIIVTAAPIVGGPKRLEWSPDSKSILATAQDDTSIWLFDATGKTPVRTIATDRWAFIRPFQPPDGKALLIAKVDGGRHSVISYDLATGHETVLAGDIAGDDGAARWSPDGSQVVYNTAPADEPDSSRLFVVRADGTGTQKLVTAPGIGLDVDPTWSPDGTEIAFTRYQQAPDLSWDVRPIGIYKMAGGTVRDVGPLPRDVRAKFPEANDAAASRGEAFFFDWSPDGRSLIAFPSEASGHAIIIDAVDGTWRALDPVVDTPGVPQSQDWQRLAP
jgi:Tol biopolymer transport system component